MNHLIINQVHLNLNLIKRRLKRKALPRRKEKNKQNKLNIQLTPIILLVLTITNTEAKMKILEGFAPNSSPMHEHYLQQQRKRGYKIGWIWYQLIEEITPSTLEICWLSVVFQYAPYWAVYKNLEWHGTGDQSKILLLIKTHQQEWLNYFQKRWGIFEEQKQKQQHKQYKQQKTSSSRQYRSTASRTPIQ